MARTERTSFAAACGSSIVRGATFVLAAPFILLGKTYRGLSVYLENSLFWRALKAFLSKFEILIGAYLLLQTIIPHQYWHNQYALAASLLLAALLLVRRSYDTDAALSSASVAAMKTSSSSISVAGVRGHGSSYGKGRADFVFFLYLLILFLSSVTSIVPSDSIRIFTVNMIPLILMLIMVDVIRERKQLDRIICFLIAGVSLASLYGIWQYINGIPVDESMVDVTVSGSISRAFATMGNPNNYAEYLVLAIPFYAAAFLNTKKVPGKLAVAALALLPILNLYLTQSRSSWLGFALAACVFIFIVERRLIPIMAIAAVAAYPLLPSSIKDRLATIGRDSSSRYRVNIWQGSFRILKDYWVTGIGTGPMPFMKLFRRYSTFTDLPAHSHMFPMQVWLETGIAGFTAFFWMMARLFKKGVTVVFRHNNKDMKYYIAASMAAITGVTFIGIFEYVWFYPRVYALFWIITGILMISLNIAADGRGSDVMPHKEEQAS
ncbi:MAG: O-antigen ligase family protein [Eubacteriales bacterium]|nr:O-antigen ligase family protein [Eubacteriales bacterium]